MVLVSIVLVRMVLVSTGQVRMASVAIIRSTVAPVNVVDPTVLACAAKAVRLVRSGPTCRRRCGR